MILMKNVDKYGFLLLLAFLVLFQNCTERTDAANEDTATGKESTVETFYSEADFSSVKKFNSHVHISTFDSTFIKQTGLTKEK